MIVINPRVEAAAESDSVASKLRVKAITEVVIQCAVTLVTLGLAVVILLSESYDESTKKMAAGWIGILLGYWLR